MQHRPGASRPVILCADDYAISAGVSRGILELAERRRISATSAIVTLPRWAEDAKALRSVRDRISVGLHVDLTLGAPLGPMPRLAPEGALPSIGALVKAALSRRIDAAEIEAEVLRQIDRFEDATGFSPDHVDGHQHAHALPGVRAGVLAAVGRRFGATKPLVRDPADRPGAILGRGVEVAKAVGIAALAAGFGAFARRHGMPTNRGFSGFSAFDTRRDYATELAAAMSRPGPLHLVMCHPGHPDAELAALDPIIERRGQELAALMSVPGLEARIWHPDRDADGAVVDWQQEGAGGE